MARFTNKGAFLPRTAGLILLLLLLGGCQPYPDHGEITEDFRANWVDFGVQRELRLARVEGDQKSLRLEFNQPLPPDLGLDLSFYPRITETEISRIGEATILVEFPTELRLAHRYSVAIPAGWRALSGASYLRRARVEWETPRPRLDEVTVLDNKEKTLSLVFNQEIEAESLSATLRIDGEPLSADSQLERKSNQEAESWELKLPSMNFEEPHQLTLAPGLRAPAGPLAGNDETKFAFGKTEELGLKIVTPQVWTSESPLSLIFSEEIKYGELERHLRGVEEGSVFVSTVDNLHFEIYPESETVSKAANLWLTPGLSSHHGKRLPNRVELRVAPNPKKEMNTKEEFHFRLPAKLPSGQTVLPWRSSEKTRVATWALSEKDLGKLLTLDEKRWRAPAKLSQEFGKPVYLKTTNKDRLRTRFLPSGKSYEKESVNGFFLVRLKEKDGAPVRYLVARSSLEGQAWKLNDNVFLGLNRGPALVELRDDEFRLLRAERIGADGFLRLDYKETKLPTFCLVKRDKDRLVIPLASERRELESSVNGALWTHRQVYEPGEEIDFFGLWWSAEGEASILLQNERGEDQPTIASVDKIQDGLIIGKLRAPEVNGVYTLNLKSDAELGLGKRFVVSAASSEERWQREFLLDEAFPQDNETGSYRWTGPGRDEVALRCRLRAKAVSKDGWSRYHPTEPRFVPVELERQPALEGESFQLKSLPEFLDSRELLLELVDKNDPNHVFLRSTRSLGTERVELQEANSTHDSAGLRKTRFRFRFPKAEHGPGKSLYCSLLKQGRGGLWESLNEGAALWKEGAYEWVVPIEASGTLQLHLAWDDGGTEQNCHWQAEFESDFVSGLKSLKLSDESVVPGQTLRLAWPELSNDEAVFLVAYAGEKLIHWSWRKVGPEGELGSLNLEGLSPGEDQILVLARAADKKETRANRVEVLNEQHFGATDLAVDIPFAGELEVAASQNLNCSALSGDRQLSTAVIWWEQSDQGGARTLLQRLAQRFERRTGLSLPALGQKELPAPQLLNFQEEARFQTLAPSQPGSYRLCFLGATKDQEFAFAELAVNTREVSRWRELVPHYLRPGDSFDAGLRFWSDPDSAAPTGATASVTLESTLLPESYFSTAALVDPGGADDMLFRYRIPEFVAPDQPDLQLLWELGVEGESQQVEASLELERSPVETSSFRRLTLKSGQSFRLNLAHLERWLLEVSLISEEAEEQSSLVLQVGDEEEKLLNLASSHLLTGEGGRVLLKHEQGRQMDVKVSKLRALERSSKLWAKSLYLLRHIEDLEGAAVSPDQLKSNGEYLLVHSLVVPKKLEKSVLRVPLPGGLFPRSCLLEKGESEPLAWSLKDGFVDIKTPSLEPGEHRVVCLVRPIVAGDYAWPASEVLDSSEKLSAGSRSGRVVISEP